MSVHTSFAGLLASAWQRREIHKGVRNGGDSGLERERESGNIGGKIAKARRLRRTQMGIRQGSHQCERAGIVQLHRAPASLGARVTVES